VGERGGGGGYIGGKENGEGVLVMYTCGGLAVKVAGGGCVWGWEGRETIGERRARGEK